MPHIIEKTIREQLAPLTDRMRNTHSLVKPVSQVVLELRGKSNDDTFTSARQIALSWLKNRAGGPLPQQAWAGEGFELYDIGSQRVAAASIDIPSHYWAALLDDSDKNVPKRSWVTEISIIQTTEETTMFGTRLHCVTHGENVPFTPSVPGFVRTLVEKLPDVDVFVEGRKVGFDPWIVQTEEDVDTLISCIENKTRSLDVIACSLPEGNNDLKSATIDVKNLHLRTLGVAHVAVLTGDACFYLTDRVGKEFSVFRGAVRNYRPDFDIGLDEPFRHPLALSERIHQFYEGGCSGFETFLIGQVVSNSVSGPNAQKQIPAFAEVKRIAAELKLSAARDAGASDADLLQLADEEITELKKSAEQERETYEGLVQQYENDRTHAIEQRLQTQSSNAFLRERIKSLESQLVTQTGELGGVPIPNDLVSFEEWCRLYLSGDVEVHNRAFQGIKKSAYGEVKLIYEALLLLRDYYIPMKQEGKKSEFEERCAQLGLTEEATFSSQNSWGEHGDTYRINHNGKKRLLERHLKKGNSREEQYCFRLYFFWDQDIEQVVVGWLPSHLQNRAT